MKNLDLEPLPNVEHIVNCDKCIILSYRRGLVFFLDILSD